MQHYDLRTSRNGLKLKATKNEEEEIKSLLSLSGNNTRAPASMFFIRKNENGHYLIHLNAFGIINFLCFFGTR
eukprot:Gb_28285 [translate_table: standard]